MLLTLARELMAKFDLGSFAAQHSARPVRFCPARFNGANTLSHQQTLSLCVSGGTELCACLVFDVCIVKKTLDQHNTCFFL
jgi:hypothetical protein